MALSNLSGERIREARLAKGWTQVQLAKELHLLGRKINAKTISLIERQKRMVLDGELFDMAVVLDVTLEQLLPSRKGD